MLFSFFGWCYLKLNNGTNVLSNKGSSIEHCVAWCNIILHTIRFDDGTHFIYVFSSFLFCIVFSFIFSIVSSLFHIYVSQPQHDGASLHHVYTVFRVFGLIIKCSMSDNNFNASTFYIPHFTFQNSNHFYIVNEPSELYKH